ncbi:MAG: hypothetical protein M1814_000467 [Vezdaea aestivalis]|nr:MAG: hypothetical protein M1814_000467 [Vezdaea aestivalis]
MAVSEQSITTSHATPSVMPEYDDEEKALSSLRPVASESSQTLLPAPVASLVSFATKSSSLYIQLGTFIGGIAIDSAKVGTLTGIELGRTVAALVLSRAGSDVVSISKGGLAKSEAETILDRSISLLHSTLTHASFLASTGFAISSFAVDTASQVSQHILTGIDSILGSTESSKAIAAIVTLIRREFRPQYGDHDEKIGVIDLLIAICGLALLQKWCFNRDQKMINESGAEEVVWDVIILNSGSRADVIATHTGKLEGTKRQEGSRPIDNRILPEQHLKKSFISTTGDHDVFEVLPRVLDVAPIDIESDEVQLRRNIMRSLPKNANVSITSEVFTRKTITVEITGCDPPELNPPAGLSVVEENSHPSHPDDKDGESSSYYRVVYTTDGGKNSHVQGIESSTSAAEGTATVVRNPSPTLSSPVPTDTIRFNNDNESRARTTGITPNIGDDQNDLLRDSEPMKHHNQGLETSRDKPAWTKSDTALSPRSKFAANQKRPRQPKVTRPVDDQSQSLHSSKDKPNAKRFKESQGHKPASDKVEKQGTLKRAFKRGASGTNLTNIFNKEPVSEPRTKSSKPPRGPIETSGPASRVTSRLAIPEKKETLSKISAPTTPQRGSSNYFSSRDLGSGEHQRSSSRTSFYSMQESRLDAQTDTYSIKSSEYGRPASPSHLRTHVRGKASITRTKSGRLTNPAPSPALSAEPKHRSSRSIEPSIYTLRTNKSEESLALVRNNTPRDMVKVLVSDGMVPGGFPFEHFVQNSCRFVKFASAAYGQHFLNVMGIASKEPFKTDDEKLHHLEHHSFSKHTKLPASTILLSSFVDPGDSPKSSETSTNTFPLIHFLTLDHLSKAVVLTCRGTLGFEDVLTDLTCDYEHIMWRGTAYTVHRGMLASARRLLYGPSSRVLITLKAALEEFPEYGLVLCGHSLGGGVASILAILLSEPDRSLSTGSSFVTASTIPTPQLALTDGNQEGTALRLPVHLPPRRPIHVYAYGTPASIAPSLRRATSGLITTIVNGQDCVPYLSLGVLRDLQDIALAFKTDTTGAQKEVRNRLWTSLMGDGLRQSSLFSGLATAVKDDDSEDDLWAYAALKSLRACMLANKLVPPGEVFVVETQEVLQREAFTRGGEEMKRDKGRPATRVVCKYIKDVEKRFGEMRFGISMLGDHSPGRYESSLEALAKGVLNV